MATAVEERRTPSEPGKARKSWWRRPWIVPLFLVVVLFLSFSLPPYFGLDPEQARIPIRKDVPWHYTMLVVHIFGGSVAVLAACLQVWPWLRKHYPTVHRWSGRAYVMVGIPFVGIPALFISPLSRSGFGGQVANTLWGILWLTCTILGYRMALKKRYAEHREWMLRSFALIFAIITNRLWGVAAGLALTPQLDTTFGGDTNMLVMVAGPMSIWLSWVTNLIIVEWWMQHTRHRTQRGRRRARAH